MCRTGRGKSSASRPKPGTMAVHPHVAGPRHRVALREVEPPYILGRGRRPELAARGVDDLELHLIAGGHRQHRLEGMIPAKMVLRPVDSPDRHYFTPTSS